MKQILATIGGVLVTLALAACTESAVEISEVVVEEAPTHLGGCILLAGDGAVPDDVYFRGDVVANDLISPFSKELQVYGLRLAARDDISDDFMRLVAQAIAEVFPKRESLDLDAQERVLRHHFRYNALVPVPNGDDFSFVENNADDWATLESNNSICDIIMQNVPVGQVMEVVEHILHYVSDIGLHHEYPNEWGISPGSSLAIAMRKAVAEGYYDVSGYNDIEDEEVRFRVEMQEFAYWFISTAWNLQADYGPVAEEEWNIVDEADLRKKLPSMYDVYQRTAARVMVAPSLETLRKFGPTRAEEGADQ